MKEKMDRLNWSVYNFKIEERRRKVASLLAQSMTESEIPQELYVDQSTISIDVKALKELSQQFIMISKSDLAYYYKQSIDGKVYRITYDLNDDNNNNELVKCILNSFQITS
jgi:hypothetical protein